MAVIFPNNKQQKVTTWIFFLFIIIRKGILFAKKKYKLSIRRHVVDCVQSFQQSLIHFDYLEALEMCVSNMKQYAL